MKRFSKMLALGLSAALVFGMTVHADESIKADDAPVTADAAKDEASVGTTTIVVDGQEVAVEFEAPAVLEETRYEAVKTEVKAPATVAKVQNQILEAVKTNLQAMVPDSLKAEVSAAGSTKTVELVGEPKVTAAFELAAPKNLTPEQIAQGVTVPFTLKQVKANVIYSVIHYLADGTTEVLPTTVSGSTIYATFTSFSPVVIVEQEIKLVGEDVPATTPDNDDDDDSSDDSATPNAAVAPKTGEAVPFAAVMALVLMAGAVVCAKKVRYNR